LGIPCHGLNLYPHLCRTPIPGYFLANPCYSAIAWKNQTTISKTKLLSTINRTSRAASPNFARFSVFAISALSRLCANSRHRAESVALNADIHSLKGRDPNAGLQPSHPFPFRCSQSHTRTPERERPYSSRLAHIVTEGLNGEFTEENQERLHFGQACL
jgi:hypothetical protein